jgi:hypothetical protein
VRISKIDRPFSRRDQFRNRSISRRTARAIAHGQREWFAERFRKWTTAAGVKDPKATARALVVLFDRAVAGSEVDGPQRASDAQWMAKKLPAG